MADNHDSLYPIRAVSAMTGVNAATLRAWERRYGLIEPSRTAKGHRLYSEADVARIRRIVTLLDQGMSPSQVGALLEAGRPAPASASGAGWDPLAQRMLDAVTRFDESDLDAVYRDALAAHPLNDVTENLTVPMLRRLGERWESGTGLVADEHFFRDYVRNALGSRLFHRARPQTGFTIVTACMPGEEHDIGLLLFNLSAEQEGIRVVSLGANTPLEDLPHVTAVTRARAIVLSTNYAAVDADVAQALRRLVADAGIPVFVGGQRSRSDREHIEQAGARALGERIGPAIRQLREALRPGS